MISKDLQTAYQLIHETEEILQHIIYELHNSPEKTIKVTSETDKRIWQNLTTASNLTTKAVLVLAQKILSRPTPWEDNQSGKDLALIKEIQSIADRADNIILNRFDENSGHSHLTACRRLCLFNRSMREHLHLKVLRTLLPICSYKSEDCICINIL